MDRDQIRLECLKLAAARTTDQKDILARAREFEAHIDGQLEKTTHNAAPTSASLTAGKDGKPAR